jgi:hypothetical protein
MLRHRILPTLMIALGVIVAGCGSGGSGMPATVPPTSAPVAPSPAPTTDGTIVPTTPLTMTAVTPVATDPSTTVSDTLGLSPDGPWRRVDSAPGITTPGLVYELMPKLWVYLPTQEDLAHGITWTFTEPDREIIEAYLQARLVFFRVTETNPFDLADPGWAEWYADGGASYAPTLNDRSSRGEVFDRDAGVVLRPVVLGEGRTETAAIVFDCMLDGGVWRLPDGSLGPDSTPGVSPNGLAAEIALKNQSFRVERIATQPEACR